MHIVPAQFSRWIGRAGNCGGSVPPRGWKSHMFQPNRAKSKTGTLCKRIPRSCQGRMGGRAGSFCYLFVRFWTPSGQTSLQGEPGSKKECDYNPPQTNENVTSHIYSGSSQLFFTKEGRSQWSPIWFSVRGHTCVHSSCNCQVRISASNNHCPP
jgi:hypothetical protein